MGHQLSKLNDIPGFLCKYHHHDSHFSVKLRFCFAQKFVMVMTAFSENALQSCNYWHFRTAQIGNKLEIVINDISFEV